MANKSYKVRTSTSSTIYIYKYKNREMREEWGNPGKLFRLPVEKYGELNYHFVAAAIRRIVFFYIYKSGLCRKRVVTFSTHGTYYDLRLGSPCYNPSNRGCLPHDGLLGRCLINLMNCHLYLMIL